jgi:thioredoxin reductase
MNRLNFLKSASVLMASSLLKISPQPYILEMEQLTADVVIMGVIMGGSYAGLSAAMVLGRALRRVVIIDSGLPCNRQTPHTHSFITQDGATPAHIAAVAKGQVLAYPTVSFQTGTVVSVTGSATAFTVRTAASETIHARKVLFATGVRDQLPFISGFAECWGISVIHCPYCHGYEYRDQPTGILVNGPTALDFGKLIRNWTKKLTIFTNGGPQFSAVQHQ